jgi:hypothetical protein
MKVTSHTTAPTRSKRITALAHVLKKNIYYLVFALLFIIKYGYYQFHYDPILDDWIQYGGYPLVESIFSTILIGQKTITTRPLASLSDPFIWGQMWNFMYVAFFIITALHLASCWFFYQVFKKNNLRIGYVALLIYGLFPFGTEATYWISASSRILVGMFFLSMALYFLSRYFDEAMTSKKTMLIAFWITHLMSFGYYEPTIALGFFGALFILMNNYKKLKTPWIVGIPILNLGLIGSYYLIFSKIGNVSERGMLIQGSYLHRWIDLINKVKYLWTEPQLQLYRNGIPRGFQVLLDNQSYAWIGLIIGISLVVGYLLYKEPRYGKNGFKLVFGIVLMIIPYLPFFLLKEGGREMRIAFFSLLGLGVVLQGLFDLLAVNRWIRGFMSGGVSVAVCLMLLVHVSELTDYKRISEMDVQIGNAIRRHLEEDHTIQALNQVVILNNKKSYGQVNTDYGTHIANATSSDWALTGLVRALERDISLPYIRVARDTMPIEYDEVAMVDFIFLGLEDNGDVVKLEQEIVENVETQQKEVRFYDEEGHLFGIIELSKDKGSRFYKTR